MIDPSLKNSLFGSVRLTKNTDIDKHGYSDRGGSFSFPDGGFDSKW